MLVMRLDEVGCRAVSFTGGKAANLSLLAARHPVPPGFCVTTAAYRQWLESGRAAGMPEEVRAATAAAYDELARRSGVTSPRVAVRSSAAAEDGHSSSFAGQYATYLNVTGVGAVQDAVERCWASAEEHRVQVYRGRRSDDGHEEAVAVLVQQLIVADVAFVAFSANPVTADPDEILINANWGLGESIVGGEAVPDSYIVRKSDGTVVEEVIADKQRMTILGPDGIRQVNVPRALRRRGTLTPSDVSAIADMTRKLEEEMGWSVDIEGALHDDSIYLLQCRPITSP